VLLRIAIIGTHGGQQQRQKSGKLLAGGRTALTRRDRGRSTKVALVDHLLPTCRALEAASPKGRH
jgi:hypothetical protein